MINRLLIILLFPAILFSQEKYKRKSYYEFSDGIEFKIIGLGKSRALDIGTQGNHLGITTTMQQAKKGYEYVEFWIKIKNNTDDDQLIDLSKFQLVDENLNVYESNLCAGNSQLNMSNCDGYEFKVKSNKSRSARIYLKPQIPKGLNIRFVRINGDDIVEF